ncbi:VIT1/CCC1 transporter family protein, partial [Candidatus Woesearchaeota archaeon]|nr:VIT1/CCC1 transporter family protein [Candidatus Woesearchaeota archaeon]
DFYYRQLETEKREIEEMPEIERKEIKDIYYQKGFRGELLDKIVRKITSNKKLWLDTMMKEELRVFPDDYDKPVKSAVVVGFAALVGSIIPIIPFFFLPVDVSIIYSLIISAIALFVTGTIKARITIGSPFKAGIEMVIVGILAALAGYLIGAALGAVYT